MAMLSLILNVVLITFLVLQRKEVSDMVDVYVCLVSHGRRTCNPANKTVKLVPERFREAVMIELTAMDLDADGKPIVE